MTDTTEDPTVNLDDFEGKPVVGVIAEVRGVDGGLNRGMALEPIVHRQGETTIIAFEVETRSIRHDPTAKDEKDGPQNRVQIYDATKAIVLEGAALDMVADQLDAQHERIVAHEERVERERGTLKARVQAEKHSAKERAKLRAAGQTDLVNDTDVEVETITVPADAPADEVGAKRADKATKKAPAKRAPAKKAAGKREVTPRPKKATTKRAPRKPTH